MLETLLSNYMAIVVMELWWIAIVCIDTYAIGPPRLETPRYTLVHDLILFVSFFAGWIAINVWLGSVASAIALAIVAFSCLWDLEEQCFLLLSAWWHRKHPQKYPRFV